MRKKGVMSTPEEFRGTTVQCKRAKYRDDEQLQSAGDLKQDICFAQVGSDSPVL